MVSYTLLSMDQLTKYLSIHFRGLRFYHFHAVIMLSSFIQPTCMYESNANWFNWTGNLVFMQVKAAIIMLVQYTSRRA